MIPVQFPEANIVLARDQGEYEPTAAHLFQGTEGRVACCFRLSDAEIEEIRATRTLWVQQLTFGRRFQPIGLSTQRPSDMPAVLLVVAGTMIVVMDLLHEERLGREEIERIKQRARDLGYDVDGERNDR